MNDTKEQKLDALELLKSYGLTQGISTLQLETAKLKIEKAHDKRLPLVVFDTRHVGTALEAVRDFVAVNSERGTGLVLSEFQELERNGACVVLELHRKIQ